MLLAEAADELADLNDLLGVKADRRLVEDEHGRISQQRLREADALAVTFGEVLDDSAALVGNLHEAHDLIDVLLLGQLDLFEVKHELEIFSDRHIGIQRRDLGEITDFLFGLARIRENFTAVNRDGTRGGRDIARDDIHGRRFSRAVGTEKAEDLARIDGEADIINSLDVAVAFCEVCHLNHMPHSFILLDKTPTLILTQKIGFV